MLSVVIYLLVYLVGGLTLIPAILLFCWFVYVVRPSRSHSAINYPSNDNTTTAKDRYDNKSGWIRLVTAAPAAKKAEIENGTRKNPFFSGAPPCSSTLFFAILRGGTLFCFQDEQQTTCHWILPVRNYTISLYPRQGKSESELFGRIMSIHLAPKSKTDTAFYMTCQRPIDKEDWYFALVSASRYFDAATKDGTTIDADAMTALRGLLDGAPMNQCWNALLGRLFLGIYKTETWRQWWHAKLENKLDKLNHYHPVAGDQDAGKRSLMRLLPLQLQCLSMGETIPCLTQVTLKEFGSDGTCIIQAQLDYTGDLLVVLRTGLHTLWRPASSLLFKKSADASLPLVLLLKLRHCSGKVIFKIKPPPTCRIWAAFETMPTMEWQVTPVVLDKQIKWSYVTHLLQTKIKELVAESLVMPNMEDFPFYDSGGLGGIFGQHNNKTTDDNDKDSAIDVDLAKDDPPMVSTLVQGYMDRIRNPDKYVDTANL